MKLPRDLSGRDLAKGLCRRWDYRHTHQVGSHMVLETEIPTHQRISIPDHKTLNVGTLGNILRAVASHKRVSREQILNSLM
jgi:predicted RNA binding protein YcfA (HicA-like mRNA interferase family)